MPRRPLDGPILDALADPVLVDPVPASVRLLGRVDEYAHALMSAWGGPGLWVPLHLAKNSALEFKLPIAPGVEYMALRFWVSGSGKVEFQSTNIGAGGKRTFEWTDTGAGKTLDAAYELSTAGAIGDSSGPLQVRSGASWAWGMDTIVVTSAASGSGGKSIDGYIWSVLAAPVHRVV